MDAKFWHQRWAENNIAFHEGQPNRLLVAYFHELALAQGRRMFLPLCGKTRDIAWLLSKGYLVAGAELSTTAIEQLFAELGAAPETQDHGTITQYSAPNIDVFAGDIFELSRSVLGPVDAVYDRAALVALPAETRKRYAAHLMNLSDTAPQFLICLEYDQNEMEGPPFSVTGDEVQRLYGDHYSISRLARVDVVGGLKGRRAATENAWLLRSRSH